MYNHPDLPDYEDMLKLASQEVAPYVDSIIQSSLSVHDAESLTSWEVSIASVLKEYAEKKRVSVRLETLEEVQKSLGLACPSAYEHIDRLIDAAKRK